MLCSHIRMILLLVPITQFTGAVSATDAKDACKNKVCNDEAKCELRDGEPYCQCIGATYFTGKYCTEQVDNCAPNPCRNGAPCSNALGQPICGPCVNGFGGHLCDVPNAGTFTKMYLHHNRYGYLAVDEQFLFTLENLGGAAFLLEFHADNYAIDAFKTDPRRPVRWQKSSDLAKVARKYGLHHADRLPYQSGFYHVTTGRFWMIGLQTLRLKVTDVDSLQSYVENTYNMQILPTKEDECRPEIELVHCADPFKPLKFDVGRYNTLQVIVRKRCWKKSELLFEWKVFNSIETVLLHSYGQTTASRLKVSPYPPWANHLGELMQSFLIRIGITELFENNETYIVARCYLFILTKPVMAQIVGGSEREVDVRDSIHLDGSPSRDFAMSPRRTSHLHYSWTCESSDDPDNKNCAKSMSTDKVLIIPVGKLKLGMSYKFTLEVQSKVHFFSRDGTTQVITLVATQPLYVDIECVRNCNARKFVPEKLMHLKALCLNCEYQTMLQYAWTLNGDQVANTKRLIVVKVNDVEKLTAQVQLTYLSRQGKAVVQLNKNKAPTGGDCKVTPAAGEELKTEFQIFCDKFEDDDQPLSYEFTAETFALDRTHDPITRVRLSKGSVVTVAICDSMRACATQSLNVDVKESGGNTGLVPFLDSHDSDVAQLLEDGDIEQAMILAFAATRFIASTDDAKYLGEQMQRFTLQTLLDAEQFLHVISDIFSKISPLRSKEANVFYKMLAKLSAGLEFVLGDGEVKELSLKTYTEFQSKISAFLEALSNPTEDILPIQVVQRMRVHTYNRIVESYPEIDVSDTEILPRINIWVNYGSTLNRCIQLMGLMASFVHEPDEPHTITDQSELHVDTYAFENRTSQVLSTPDGVAEIILETAVIFELQALLHSTNLLLQIISTPKDPFWWLPDDEQINTGVLYLSEFSTKLKASFLKGVQLDEILEFTFKLNSLPQGREDSSTHMLGRLESNADMNIFQIFVPKNALLAVDFVSTTIDLQVLLELNTKPSGYRTHRSEKFIKKAGTNQPVMLVNTRNTNLNAYLAVVPAENVSEEHALFAFVPELRECLSWSFDLVDPQWTTNDCRPKVTESLAKELHCYCKHMSTFAGKVLLTTGFSLHRVGDLIDDLPFNWFMIYAQIAVGLTFIFWVLIAYFCLRPNREHLVITPKIRNPGMSNISNGEIIVRFTTGGYRNASTTAGVIIILSTVNGPMKFKIYQNPKNPHLKQHSTCTVRLPLNPELLTRPVTVFLRHDGGGRYPTWYCRYLEIDFPKLEKPIYLSVDCWVDEEGLQLLETNEPKKRKHEKWKSFAANLDTICTNWFFYNPLFGPWKYGNMTCNRFERTLIWMLKMAFSIFIISVSYGWTTLHNYEEEREEFQYVRIDLLHIFLLSLLSFFIGSVLQFGIEYWIFKTTQESFESPV